MFTDVSLWKQLALLFFFLFFCGVLAWVFFSARASQFSHDASLPLDEGKPVCPSSSPSVEEVPHV